MPKKVKEEFNESNSLPVDMQLMEIDSTESNDSIDSIESHAENIGAETATEHNAMIGHNSTDSVEIPKLTDDEIASAIANLKLVKAQAKGEIATIRIRIYLAELRLLIPAMEQAHTFRNSNFLVKLVAGAGLAGPIKRALSMTIPNLVNVKDGRLVLDVNKTPLTHISESTGKPLPLWDMSRWAFLKQVYATEVASGVNPISDSWNEVFPSPEKTNSELREGFASQIKSMTKKGLTLQDMLAILQEKMAEGNLTE